jgi:hypothetical protein
VTHHHQKSNRISLSPQVTTVTNTNHRNKLGPPQQKSITATKILRTLYQFSSIHSEINTNFITRKVQFRKSYQNHTKERGFISQVLRDSIRIIIIERFSHLLAIQVGNDHKKNRTGQERKEEEELKKN